MTKRKQPGKYLQGITSCVAIADCTGACHHQTEPGCCFPITVTANPNKEQKSGICILMQKQQRQASWCILNCNPPFAGKGALRISNCSPTSQTTAALGTQDREPSPRIGVCLARCQGWKMKGNQMLLLYVGSYQNQEGIKRWNQPSVVVKSHFRNSLIFAKPNRASQFFHKI